MDYIVGEDLELERISANRLNVADYQRDAKRTIFTRMARRFHDKSFVAVVVGKRKETGKYYIIDGLQRVNAAIELYGPNVVVPCVVIETTYMEEAEMFGEINGDRVSPSNVEVFDARVKGGDEESMDILFTVEECGYKVCKPGKNGTKGANSIGCIHTLIYIYQDGGPKMLRKVLNTISLIWPNDRDSTRGPVIGGVYMFLTAYTDKIDTSHLLKSLRKITPERLQLEAASQKPSFGGGQREWLVAKVITDLYNYRKREKKLTDWVKIEKPVRKMYEWRDE